MYSGGPLHKDEQRQGDQLEPTYSSSLPIQDVTLKTCRKQWTIRRGGERGSGRSVLMARRDDESFKMQQTIAKDNKTRHDWVGKVIHWELCKKLKFDHIYKWYIHKLKSDLENETHRILRDFEIQTDHQIPARKSDLLILNKKNKNCAIVDFTVSAIYRVKTKEK